MFLARRSLGRSSRAETRNALSTKYTPLSKLKDIAIYLSRGLDRNINCLSKHRKSPDDYAE